MGREANRDLVVLGFLLFFLRARTNLLCWVQQRRREEKRQRSSLEKFEKFENPRRVTW